MPRNMRNAETEAHFARIGALNSTLVNHGLWSTFDDAYRRWLGKQYVSTQRGGTCYF